MNWELWAYNLELHFLPWGQTFTLEYLIDLHAFFSFVSHIHQSTKFQNITLFKVFFIYTRPSVFYWNSHILINDGTHLYDRHLHLSNYFTMKWCFHSDIMKLLLWIDWSTWYIFSFSTDCRNCYRTSLEYPRLIHNGCH